MEWVFVSPFGDFAPQRIYRFLIFSDFLKWNRYISLLEEFVSTIMRSVEQDYLSSLRNEVRVISETPENPTFLLHTDRAILAEARRHMTGYMQTNTVCRALGEIMLPLMEVLLQLQSPVFKEVVYQVSHECYGLGGSLLGFNLPDSVSLLSSLDQWKAFLDSQIELLPRYLADLAARKNPGEETEWSCAYRYQGGGASLIPVQRAEQIIDELDFKHFWGLNYLGVPGKVGDKAFDIAYRLIFCTAREILRARGLFANSFEIKTESASVPHHLSEEVQDQVWVYLHEKH